MWSDLSRPPLDATSLRRALTDGPQAPWRLLDVVPATGSTNADVAARARQGEPAGYVLTTDDQRSGRGRLDRSWDTPARSAIAVSVLLRPSVPQERWGWLPLLTGLAVVDALTGVCGLQATLKWPNDVLVPVRGQGETGPGEERKVCGVLAELVAAGPDGAAAVVVGTGINVSQSDDELPVPTATSLLTAGAATTDRNVVLRAYLRALADRLQAWEGAGGDPRGSGVGAAYREACATLGRQVTVTTPGGVREGLAQEVDDDGRLVVLTDDPSGGGLLHLAAGDVVHVRPADGGAAAR